MKYEINSVMKAPTIHVKNLMNPIVIILSEKEPNTKDAIGTSHTKFYSVWMVC